MRIIYKGIPPENLLYEATCQHCKTIFEFERKEAKFHSDQRDGDFLDIDCPVCSTKVIKVI